MRMTRERRGVMKVTIVIPNYNGKHFMEECMAALDGQLCRDFEVLVVDNGSKDGSVAYMKERYPEVRLGTDVGLRRHCRKSEQKVHYSKF